ncbi:MAG: HEAT repeat domain-containing protein [Fibrobacteria bacterium]|nr:HEAT repeat domain-containing protein [Fibrobacteria bacterium]
MNEELIQKALSSNNKAKITETLFALERNGDLSHLKIIMAQSKRFEEKDLKQYCYKAASSIIKRGLINDYTKFDEHMRKSLLDILQTIDPQVVKNFSEELKSENDLKRLNVVKVLGLLGKDSRIKDVVKTVSKDKSEKVRATAISLMRYMPEMVSVEVLLGLMKDKDKRVVANCIEVIEALLCEKFISSLQEFKKDENNRIRANALKALWKTGINEDGVYRGLNQMINDKDNHLMRASACWVIGECATQDDDVFIDLLVKCLDDKEKLVRENMIKALLKIGGKAKDQYLDMIDPDELETMRKIMAGIKPGKRVEL